MYRYTYIGIGYTPRRVQDRRLYAAVAICQDNQQYVIPIIWKRTIVK